MKCSRGPGSRNVALGLLAIVLVGSTAAWAEGPIRERTADRNSDQEPNNNIPENAPELLSGYCVEGTLLTAPADDSVDYYKMTVPYGKVVNATLYMVDHDPWVPWQYNFDIALRYRDDAGLQYLDVVRTESRTEAVIIMQSWKPGAPETVYIEVKANLTADVPPQPASSPGRYRMSGSVGDPQEWKFGDQGGSLHNLTGPRRAYYCLNPGPEDNKGITIKLKVPDTGNFNLALWNIWPVDGQWWQQNVSMKRSKGGTREATVTGVGGPYYIFLDAVDGPAGGFGTYILSNTPAHNALDNDNFPSNALLTRTNEPLGPGFLAQGVDAVDWFRVNMRAGRPLPLVTFSLAATATNWGVFGLTAFDKDFKFLAGDRTGEDGGTEAHLRDVTVNYNGTAYFAVRTVGPGYEATSGNWMPARGWYWITFDLPNDPPLLEDPLPDIVMDEDVPDESLILAEHYLDADGDTLTYGLAGAGYRTRPSVDKASGRVTFTPQIDWSGKEVVRFYAEDDGPGSKRTECSTNVTVRPVNDPPQVVAPPPEIRMREDEEAFTSDLSEVFVDHDDAFENLTFSCRAVSASTHPPASQLPVEYNAQNRTFRLGPARGFFGTFTMRLECAEDRPGAVAASVHFQVNLDHVNHAPAVNSSLADPAPVPVKEGGKASLVLLDLITDLDLPAGYANDRLEFSIFGQQRLAVNLTEELLLVDTGREEYLPGVPYSELITLSARDKAGLTASLGLKVVVEAVDDPPEIVACQPTERLTVLNEGESREFTVSATDVDTPPGNLTHSWFVDGGQDGSARGSAFLFVTDFSMGGALHRVRVDVSDGTSTVSKQWNVSINDVNRLPAGALKAPLNGSKFKKGKPVAFLAEGSDPDGDVLQFTWKDAAGHELGKGANFTTKELPRGTQVIRLEISDGKGIASLEVTVTVTEEAAKKSPGFGALALAGAALLLWAAAPSRRRP